MCPPAATAGQPSQRVTGLAKPKLTGGERQADGERRLALRLARALCALAQGIRRVATGTRLAMSEASVEPWPSRMVRKGGLEPPRSCERQPLKPDGTEADRSRPRKTGVGWRVSRASEAARGGPCRLRLHVLAHAPAPQWPCGAPRDDGRRKARFTGGEGPTGSTRGATVAPRPAHARVRRPRRSGGVCPELEHALDTHPAERLRADAERAPGPPPVGLLRNASLAKILADAPVDRPRSWPVGSTAGPSGGYGDGGGGNGATLGEG